MTLADNYLKNVKAILLLYKTTGEKAIEQIPDNQLFFSANEDSNSIATIVRHLYGNMISRWTDFLNTDGEKPWRNRDGEFNNDVTGKEELMRKWVEGWACMFGAVNELKGDQLTAVVYIRNEAHTVLEALNRQLAHYSYHVGQIVFAAKQLKKESWISLSIPKNKSNNFNVAKSGNKK